MKKWEGGVKDWCRSFGITLVATLIVAAILCAVLYITPPPHAQNGVASKTGQRPSLNSERDGGQRPGKAAQLALAEEDAVRRAGNKKHKGDETSEQTSTASGVGSGPRKEDRFRLSAPVQTTVIGPASGADGNVPGLITKVKAADSKTSEAQWRKILGDLHTKGFHVRRGSATTKRQAREKVEAELDVIVDPRAVPAIWRVFAGSPDHHQLVARMLTRIKSSESTIGLVYLAVESPDEKARRLATNALRTHDPVEFVDPLISFFNSPLTWRPDGFDIPGQGRARVLLIEGERENYRLVYPPPDKPGLPRGRPGVYDVENPYLTPEQRRMAEDNNRAQADMARAATEGQVREQIEQVKLLNQRIAVMNERAVGVLREATSKAFMPPNREAWRRWLADRQGYAYVPPASSPKPTLERLVPHSYTPDFIAIPAPT